MRNAVAIQLNEIFNVEIEFEHDLDSSHFVKARPRHDYTSKIGFGGEKD